MISSYLQIISNKKLEQLKKNIFCFFAIFFILILFQYNLYNNKYIQIEINCCIKLKDLQYKIYNNTKIEPKQTIVKIIRI